MNQDEGECSLLRKANEDEEEDDDEDEKVEEGEQEEAYENRAGQ